MTRYQPFVALATAQAVVAAITPGTADNGIVQLKNASALIPKVAK